MGLGYQVNEVSESYFKYPTQSKVVVIPHFSLKVPSLSACLRVADVIKVEEINRDLNLNLFHPTELWSSWTEWTERTQTLTLGDRLKYTPRIDELLDPKTGCAIRTPGKDHLEYFPGGKCNELFDTSKYYHRESVCYKFTPRMNANELAVKHYTLTDEAYGMIFFILMNPKMFKDIKVISSYIHNDESIKLYDALLAQYIMIPNDKIEILPTFNTINLTRLEPPFDTQCQKYPPGSAMVIEILKKIQNETLTELNRSIPALMIPDDGDEQKMSSLLMTSSALTMNETLKKRYREIVEKYQDNGRYSCSISCMITRISFGKDEQFQFRIAWPDGLKFSINYEGKNTVIDYIVYICSCVGIWFGISAFSLFDNFRDTFVGREGCCGNRSHYLANNHELIAIKAELRKQQLIYDWRFYRLRKRLDAFRSEQVITHTLEHQ